MKYVRFGSQMIVSFAIGEEIVNGLVEVCQAEGIACAQVTGIGATGRAVLGAYDLASRKYRKTTYAEPMEIVSIVGNVTVRDGKPFPHLHAVLGREDLSVVGGHLFEAFVSLAGEMTLTVADGVVERRLDPETGLSLIRIEP